MSLKPVNNRALNVTYQRAYRSQRVQIEKPGTYGRPSRMTHWKQEHHDELVADFDIQIDVEAIARMLIRKAQVNKTGRAGAMAGLIKVIRRNERVMAQTGNTVPVPEGWSEVAS